jgi:hypothetical protein
MANEGAIFAEAKHGPNRTHQQTIAARIVADPELLGAVIHLLSWMEPATLDVWIETMQRERAHREEVLAACREARFGEKFVAPT